MGISNFNKIVDLYFYGESTVLPVFALYCPRKGRKPNIQITGMFYSDSELQNLEIKIKNLYIDLTQKKFNSIKIVAGYENKTVTMWGNIWYMYRESPGPESVTIIHCTTGQIEKYLTGTINTNYDEGATLQSVITDLSNKMGYTNAPEIDTSIASKTFSSPLMLNDTAEGAVKKLKETLESMGVALQLGYDTVYCYATDSAGFNKKLLYCLSTPPQLLGDGENPGSLVTITAPWDPSVRAGDTVSCPSTFYVGSSVNGVQAALLGNKLDVKITTLQFQFSTVASMNSMIIQGITV